MNELLIYLGSSIALASNPDSVLFPGTVDQGSFLQMIKPWVVWGSLGFVIGFGLFVNNKYRELKKRNTAKHDRPNRSTTNELGSGDLASKEQVQKWLTPTGELDTVFPVKDLKGSDGIILKKGNLVVPPDERNRHMLIIAKTGSGKTTKLILPVLYSDCLCPVRSSIVLDSKPEMWDKVAAMTRKYNPEKKILLFNPLDTLRSLSWNILEKVEDDTDAKLIANTIIMATDNPQAKQDSPFFRNNALQVLNSVMIGLLNDPDETISMPRIHQLIHSGMNKLCDWLEAHPKAIRNCRTFVELARSGSQNADTIMSELGMRLSAWDLTAIRSTTFQNELDIQSLVNDPTLLIVELRESELEMLRPMANVIVIEILRYLTKTAERCPGGKLPRPASLIIDEFASALGKLPDIHVKLNTLRSRNVSIVAAIQSIAQVKANYKEDADSVLAGFSTKILMPALDFQDAEWASKETGQMTVRFNVQHQGHNKRVIDYFSSRSDTLMEQVQQRAVLTPDEIGRPADNASTFFMPNTPVFQGHLVPFYEDEVMSKRIGMKGEELKLREGKIVYEEQPLPHEEEEQAAKAASEKLKAYIEEAKPHLGYHQLAEHVGEWWHQFEEVNAENMSVIENVMKELIKRDATITDFYDVCAATKTTDVTEALGHLDSHLLTKLKPLAGWDSLSQPAQDWWRQFEEANVADLSTVVSLLQQLLKKHSTIEMFFGAYVHSEANSIPDVLKVLDKMTVKKKEELTEQDLRPKVASKTISTASLVEGFQAQVANGSLVNGTNGHTSGVDFSGLAEGLSNHVGEVVEETKTTIQDVKRFSKNGSKEISQSIKRTTSAKNAAEMLKIESYFDMGRDFLANGKLSDFQALIGLASEDPAMDEHDIDRLKELAE